MKNPFKSEEVIKGYKGFDKDMNCRGFKFEEGKEYHQEGNIKACSNGFHLCQNPLDVLTFYPLNNSIFAEVEGSGSIDKEENKVAVENIKIIAKLNLPVFIKASVEFVWDKASEGGILNKNNATSGYGAHSATSGNDGIACSVGRKAKAKASLGCFIVLAEWKEGESFTDAKPIDVKSAKVDGKKIKAEMWYKLVDGKFVETDDSNE